MERLINVALSNFSDLPPSLVETGAGNKAVERVTIDLAKLYHHYYLDAFDNTPPDPDPVHFEHLRFLCPTKDFCLLGEGIGASSYTKRNKSTELGCAFCRW